MSMVREVDFSHRCSIISGGWFNLKKRLLINIPNSLPKIGKKILFLVSKPASHVSQKTEQGKFNAMAPGDAITVPDSISVPLDQPPPTTSNIPFYWEGFRLSLHFGLRKTFVPEQHLLTYFMQGQFFTISR
jgi:hypothetical protein